MTSLLRSFSSSNVNKLCFRAKIEISSTGRGTVAHCEKHDKLPQKGECFIHQASDVAPNSPDVNLMDYAVSGAR